MNQTNILAGKKVTELIPDLFSGRKLKDRLFLIGIVIFSLLTISMVVLIIGSMILKGYHQINWAFFTQSPPDTFQAMMAKMSGKTIPGGIINGITGSLYLVGIASLIAIPFGVLIGIYLYENSKKKYAGFIRDITDVLQGVPSI
ncbi:MAG: hypothetical protein WC542_13330, partial [Paludibacter sp.]